MKTLFTLFFTFLTISAFAQSNFVPGFYITKQGERVEAQINDLNWDRNPTFIEVSQGDDLIRLGVDDIKSFGLSSGDLYYLFSVEIDKSPSKINDIVPNSQPLIVRENVFLKTIVKGPASLYYLNDDKGKAHYFLQKEDDEPVELIYRTAVFLTEGKTSSTKLPIYRGMLTAKLSDCPDATIGVNKLSFKYEALKEFVEKYNMCISGTTGSYKEVKEGVKWKLAPSGGLGYTILKFESSEFKALTEPNFSSIHYTAGISVQATLPRSRERWAIQGDLVYRPFKAEGEYTEMNGSNSTHTETKFDMGFVGLYTSIRYRFMEGKVRPYISAGVSSNLLVSDNSSQIIHNKYYTTESKSYKMPLEETRKHEQGGMFSFGVESSKFGADFKVENGNGNSPYLALKSTRRTYSFTFSYSLN